MASFQGLRPADMSRFLHITLWDVKYPVSEQALYQVFLSFGAATVRFCTSTTAVVSFPTMSQATRAGLKLQGRCIYNNCCWMQIQFASEPTPATGTARQASRAPACTPVEAPQLASISAASVDATPAPVCVLASPARSPSALTAADEKPVMASWAELQAKLEHILAKLAPMDNTAASSSPSTTTTSPVTAPQHGPPSATTTAVSTTTAPPPTEPVLAPATLEEFRANIDLTMDNPLKLNVVPELSMPAPAKCSTECQDVLHQPCKAALVSLGSTNVFTPMEKAAVLEATSRATASSVSLTDVNHAMAVQGLGVVLASKPLSTCLTNSSLQSVDGRAGVTIPAASVLVAAIRVPPRPPDLHLPVAEDYDTTKVMEEPLLEVVSKPSMTGSIHQKEHEQERPMPWPSFVCYWPTTSSLKPWQTPQVITLKLLIEDMQIILGCIQRAATLLPGIGQNTSYKQYATYSAALATTSGALVSITGVLQFLLIWDPGITKCVMEILYYTGNTIGVVPSTCRTTAVQQYMTSDDRNPLASYITHHCTTPALVHLEKLIGMKPKAEINGLHVYYTCVWLSFPWNPALHTWFCCCCRTFQQRYGFGGFSEIFIGRVPVMGFYLAMIDVCLQYAEHMKPNASSCELQVADHYKLNWWLEFAVPWVFSEVSCEPDDSVGQKFLHWAIYQQAHYLALPWDPGGNFPSAWGQADFQAGEYIMYQVYAMYWAQPRSTKRTKSTAKPTGPSLTQTWVCPVYREMSLCNAKSGESRVMDDD